MEFKEYILENINHYNPEYADGNSDHFPMALFALQKIGGTDAELLNFYKTYTERLETHVPRFQELIGKNLDDFFGKHELFDHCYKWISSELQEKGIERVVRDVLALTLDGICTAAFHTLIRLAYAVEMNIQEEIAAALAYYITRADLIKQLPAKFERMPEDENVLSILEKLRIHAEITYPKVGGSIFKKVNDITAQDDFQKFCSTYIPAQLSIGEISGLALHTYVSTKDFLSLHLVTSSHALRVLLPFIENKDHACRTLLIGHLAGYVSLQKPKVDKTILLEHRDKTFSPAWEELFRLARATNDDHSFKLIYSCYEESKIYQDRNYNYCAALRVVL